jgi:hypothetical protein
VDQQRYRCGSCGNLTRFDVVVSRRTRAFHHYTVGGELSVEDEEVLAEDVEDVQCRWCGTGAAVEALDPALDPGVGTAEEAS